MMWILKINIILGITDACRQEEEESPAKFGQTFVHQTEGYGFIIIKMKRTQ